MQEHVHSTVNITPMGLDGRMKLPMPTDTIPSISSGSLAHLLISRFGKLPPRVPWIYSPKLDENDWWWVVRFCTGSAIELLWKSKRSRQRRLCDRFKKLPQRQFLAEWHVPYIQLCWKIFLHTTQSPLNFFWKMCFILTYMMIFKVLQCFHFEK